MNFWILLSLLVAAVDLVLIATIVVHIILKKNHPSSALLWVVIVVALPYAGSVLYLLLGIERVPRELRRKKEVNRSFRGLRSETGVGNQLKTDPESRQGQFLRLLDRLTAHRTTLGNTAKLLENGEQAYPALLDAIRNATHHIHVDMYIIRQDDIGTQVISALVERAMAGVEVRMLYDGIGAWGHGSWIERNIRKAGGRAEAFVPLNFLKWKWRINCRNHRKIIVIDGSIGFTGSANIGDEYYFNREPVENQYRDLVVQVEGPIVGQLQQVFAEDWYFTTSEDLSDDAYFPTPEANGDVPMRVLPSGPDEDFEVFYHLMFSAFTMAEQSIRIVTPYFVPDRAILTALKSAAMRGVDIEILIPKRSDSVMVDLAARKFLGPLLEDGIRVGYVAYPMIHTKLILIDNAWATLGSGNLDERSFFLNYEANISIGPGPLIDQLNAAVEKDRDRAEFVVELDEWARKTWIGRHLPTARRLIENACALFAPIL